MLIQISTSAERSDVKPEGSLKARNRIHAHWGFSKFRISTIWKNGHDSSQLIARGHID